MANERESDQTSFASLVGGVVNDIRELFRQEVNLARVEIRQELLNAKSAAIKLAVAAFALLMAAIFLLTALARGLSALLHWPVWSGFAVVGVLLAIVGGIIAATARRNLRAAGPIPARTARTIKENVEWVKRETS